MSTPTAANDVVGANDDAVVIGAAIVDCGAGVVGAAVVTRFSDVDDGDGRETDGSDPASSSEHDAVDNTIATTNSARLVRAARRVRT